MACLNSDVKRRELIPTVWAVSSMPSSAIRILAVQESE